MNVNKHSACIATVASLLMLVAASAQERGLYVKADIGPALTEDVNIKQFGVGLIQPAPKFKTDLGLRFDVGAGYNFNRWLAADFETGIACNTIRDQNESTLSSVPLMVNAVLNIPVSQKFVPFIGAGGGAAL